MFLFEFILNDGTIQESFKGVKELESAVHGVTVIKSLGDDSSQSSFEFLDFGSEGQEIGIKRFGRNIHNIVMNSLEGADSFLELLVDLDNTFSEGLALGTTNINSF